MDFTLGKEHEMARTLFHDFAEKEVKPLAQEVDEEERFPVETVEKMVSSVFRYRRSMVDRAVIRLHTLCALRSFPKFAVLQALSFPHIHPFAWIRS